MVKCELDYFSFITNHLRFHLNGAHGPARLTVSFRSAVISELARRMVAANVTHACHLLLTGINKNLIWGNYEKPTHYAIWFMFWHVAIIGLIAEKPSFPGLYGPCFNCRPSRGSSPLPCVWSANCLKTSPQVCFMMLEASSLSWGVMDTGI